MKRLPIVIATCKQLNSLDQKISNKIHPETVATIEMVAKYDENIEQVEQENKPKIKDSPAAKKLLKGFIIGISTFTYGCYLLFSFTQFKPHLNLNFYFNIHLTFSFIVLRSH